MNSCNCIEAQRMSYNLHLSNSCQVLKPCILPNICIRSLIRFNNCSCVSFKCLKCIIPTHHLIKVLFGDKTNSQIEIVTRNEIYQRALQNFIWFNWHLLRHLNCRNFNYNSLFSPSYIVEFALRRFQKLRVTFSRWRSNALEFSNDF